MTWTKEPAYTGTIHQGCLHCGVVTTTADLGLHVSVGFGFAGIKKDGQVIYSEPYNAEWDKIPTLRKFERMAQKDPDHDWRLILEAPLRSRVYQRHGKNEWVLIASGQGFA